MAERERHRAEATVFLDRRLEQLANERERLLKAYYADAIDVATLKREQSLINAEVAEAESANRVLINGGGWNQDAALNANSLVRQNSDNTSP